MRRVSHHTGSFVFFFLKVTTRKVCRKIWVKSCVRVASICCEMCILKELRYATWDEVQAVIG